jgi:hypothetical protein
MVSHQPEASRIGQDELATSKPSLQPNFPGGRPPASKSPEPRPSSAAASERTPNGHPHSQQEQQQKERIEKPSSPGHLPPFDWKVFEGRWEEALAEADRQEQELLGSFEHLVHYFNQWAAAASIHDSHRGVKRLQTRERFVRIAEQSLAQKRKHLQEVVRAFKSALALLSQS